MHDHSIILICCIKLECVVFILIMTRKQVEIVGQQWKHAHTCNKTLICIGIHWWHNSHQFPPSGEFIQGLWFPPKGEGFNTFYICRLKQDITTIEGLLAKLTEPQRWVVSLAQSAVEDWSNEECKEYTTWYVVYSTVYNEQVTVMILLAT